MLKKYIILLIFQKKNFYKLFESINNLFTSFPKLITEINRLTDIQPYSN